MRGPEARVQTLSSFDPARCGFDFSSSRDLSSVSFGLGPPDAEGALFLYGRSERLGENRGDLIDRAGDGAGEEADRDDHDQRDDGKNHAVLGHRLALLALLERLCGVPRPALRECKELQHLVHLPSAAARAPQRARPISSQISGTEKTVLVKNEPKKLAAIVGHAGSSSVCSAWPRRLMAQMQRSS